MLKSPSFHWLNSLSPRVRGNQRQQSASVVSTYSGLSPARAGEPLAVVYTPLLSHKPKLYLTAQKAVFSLPALSLDAVGSSCT